MKTNLNTKFPYTPFATYCIRTPILPLEYYTTLVSNSKISDEYLKSQLDIPIIAEAIYLASPTLYFQLERWRNNEDFIDKKSKRLRLTLMKYLVRMSTRCTPFGLFSAVGTGELNSKTEIKLHSLNEFEKHSNYDMHFLVSLANNLANNPKIKKQLKFYPNTSIYKIGDTFRYMEYAYENKRRVYSLQAITSSDYLEIILDQHGGNTIKVLSEKLEDVGIDILEAEAFIDELIANQILVSEFEASVTGKDFIEDLKQRLLCFSGVNNEIELVENLRASLKKIDKIIGNPIKSYQSITDLVLKSDVPYDIKYLIQTNTYSRFEINKLSYKILKKINQGIAFLNKISLLEKNDTLEKFKKDFIKRYDHEKMPLSKVLDIETGIGYIQNSNSLNSTPFLDDIIDATKSYRAKDEKINLAPFQKILAKKLPLTLSKNSFILELYDEDFPKVDFDWSYAPDTLSVMTEILIEDGKEKVIMNYCSNHACKLLGRFGADNKVIKNLLEEIVDKESAMNSNVIMAEVVHLPQSRTGNILRRPQLRKHEIPYLGKSNLPDIQQIKLDNILVAVENNSIKLYNKNTNQQILVRSSNAHNFSTNSLPIYHFLCDLQSQEHKGFGFSWGNLFAENTFLPRVVYKDCIFSLAKWYLKKEDVAFLFTPPKNVITQLHTIRSWRNENKIPIHVKIVDGDNTLPINFDNYDSIELFLEIIKNKDKFVLEEFQIQAESFIKNSTESFANQFVFSFYNKKRLEDVRNN